MQSKHCQQRDEDLERRLALLGIFQDQIWIEATKVGHYLWLLDCALVIPLLLKENIARFFIVRDIARSRSSKLLKASEPSKRGLFSTGKEIPRDGDHATQKLNAKCTPSICL
jgi:hypothetical protein